MKRALVRPWAWPLVPLYRAGLWGKEALWRAGIFKQQRLTWPVLSVGSLSAGGAGKTPVVKMLAELLGRKGVRVDVLSRGYGRQSRIIERVDPAGDAERFGDEPLEMARWGLEVYVGADRYAAGLLAEARGGWGVHLLDDGMQHRRLLRDINVVLVTLADVEDYLLPAGNLRESLSALSRADVFVLRAEEAEAITEALAGTRLLERPCWRIHRTMKLPEHMPSRPVAFCGIARPEEFFTMLRQSGCEALAAIPFPDHHRYTNADVRRLTLTARDLGADEFVTTAKDAVKLSTAMQTELNAIGPVTVAELRVKLADEAAALTVLRPVLSQRPANVTARER